MSIRVITAVMQLSPVVVSPTERLVLFALAWHADEHGRNAWPAVATIARETSLTRRAIQKILPRLKAKNLVFVQSLAARGSVRYGVDMGVLDRERYSQSDPSDCEPDSQSEPDDCEPGSGGGERGSPDPSVNRPSESSLKKINPPRARRVCVHTPTQERKGKKAPYLDREAYDRVMSRDLRPLAELEAIPFIYHPDFAAGVQSLYEDHLKRDADADDRTTPELGVEQEDLGEALGALAQFPNGAMVLGSGRPYCDDCTRLLATGQEALEHYRKGHQLRTVEDPCP